MLPCSLCTKNKEQIKRTRTLLLSLLLLLFTFKNNFWFSKKLKNNRCSLKDHWLVLARPVFRVMWYESPKCIDREGLGSCCIRTRQDVYNVFYIPWLSPTSSIALCRADDDQFSLDRRSVSGDVFITVIKRKKIAVTMYSLG